MAQSGHAWRFNECPLLGVKQTSRFQGVMSAFDPKRTLYNIIAQRRGWDGRTRFRQTHS
jgi:hypothetical protein